MNTTQETREMNGARIGVLALVLFIGILAACNGPKQRILRESTDERGLTSVQFIDERGDTVALDYLSKHELDSLVEKLR